MINSIRGGCEIGCDGMWLRKSRHLDCDLVRNVIFVAIVRRVKIKQKCWNLLKELMRQIVDDKLFIVLDKKNLLKLQSTILNHPTVHFLRIFPLSNRINHSPTLPIH